MKNKFGLSRSISRKIKKIVRQRCKFGCVLCRGGIYQYEHIDDYAKVAKHDPDRICCLCGTCHHQVTHGQRSKAEVEAAYTKIWNARPEEVEPPGGILDFHTGRAELVIGGFQYSPLISSVVRYHGTDLITVNPGKDGKMGAISAVFFDDQGKEVFAIEENEWEGNPDNWDLSLVGKRFEVKNPSGRVVLALRLQPPGVIVIERLDMRCDRGHVLVSESTYALGRYFDAGTITWLYAEMKISGVIANAVGLEFALPSTLQKRAEGSWQNFRGLSTPDRRIAFGPQLGFMHMPLGISIGYGSTASQTGQMVVVDLPIDQARKYVFEDPRGLSAAYQQAVP